MNSTITVQLLLLLFKKPLSQVFYLRNPHEHSFQSSHDPTYISFVMCFTFADWHSFCLVGSHWIYKVSAGSNWGDVSPTYIMYTN